MNQLLTTTELAEHLGVKPPTIRTWAKRYAPMIQEGTHYVIEGKNKLWTVAALALFQGETQSETQDQTQTETQTETVDEVLQPVADAIALQVLEQRLPLLVQQSINRMIETPTERDSNQLVAMLDRVGTGLGLIKLSSALALGLGAAVSASRESLKQLEGADEAN